MKRISSNISLIAIISLMAIIVVGIFLALSGSSSLIVPKKNISTVILPYDDDAKGITRNTIQTVSGYIKPQTIILISGKHSDESQTQIVTAKKDWETTNGTIYTNNNLVNEISKLKFINEEASIIEKEPGIINLLPIMKETYPSSQLVPIIIKDSTDPELLNQLNQELIKEENCLLIVSIKFSHNLTGTLNEIHDAFTLQSLYSLNEDKILKAETDSPESLYLAMIWAKGQQTFKFHLEDKTNSNKILRTSTNNSNGYISGWYEQGDKEENVNLTIMLGGDAMFGREVYYRYQKDLTDAFEILGKNFFMGTDLSMVNLEGPIIDKEFLPERNADNLNFKFPLQSADVLKWLNISAVGLANNHTLNQGDRYFRFTKDVLAQQNIVSVGNPSTVDDQSILRIDENGKKLSIIGVNCLDGTPNLEDSIKSLKKLGYFTIVFPHWGNEYQTRHSINQERLAHLWINQGADLIVGSHPHVIQDAEIYEGKAIFYSLGNFIFDQSFSEDTQTGLVLALQINNFSISIIPVPISLKNIKPAIIGDGRKIEIIDKLKKQMGLPTGNYDYGYDKIEIGI